MGPAAACGVAGGERVGEATSANVLWPHQIRAFDRLYQHWPPKLLIADEVGLGKTIQAGLLLRQVWLAGRAKRILFLAPKSVCKQWQIELREKFNLNWPIYDGHKPCWHKSPAGALAVAGAAVAPKACSSNANSATMLIMTRFLTGLWRNLSIWR